MAGAVRTKAYQQMLVYLIEARRDAKLSQAGLAKQLGKPPSFVGKYELGERRLDVVEMIVVLKVLKVPPLQAVEMIMPNVPSEL